MAAGLATFREVLTRENYAHVEKLSHRLADGYRRTIAKVGLQAYIVSAGADGALMLYPKEVRDYRDWITIDTELWRHYWFAMVNRGVLPQPHWWDEQWTISVQHTVADINNHLAAFEDVAPAPAKAQERTAGAVVAGAR
jgi:glutamate-1-semialdehyde 2,1-aminomutase